MSLCEPEFIGRFSYCFFVVCFFFRLESNSSSNEVIEALKTKLKDKDSDQKTKCLICMVSFVKFFVPGGNFILSSNAYIYCISLIIMAYSTVNGLLVKNQGDFVLCDEFLPHNVCIHII